MRLRGIICGLVAFGTLGLVAAPSLQSGHQTVADAVDNAPGVAASVEQVPGTQGDGETADGFVIGEGSNAITVDLAKGRSAQSGTLANGSKIYRSGDGTFDAVVKAADGTQFLKVIDDSADPESFDYTLDLPEGATVKLTTPSPGGLAAPKLGALIFGSDGAVISAIDTPWAVDANGKQLPTHFVTDGSTLTQVIDHRGTDAAYPIVADPYFRWYSTGVVITLSYNDMVGVAAGGIYTLQAMLAAGLFSGGLSLIPSVMLVGAVSAASWGVAVHQCFWFWVPYPWAMWASGPDRGWYAC